MLATKADLTSRLANLEDQLASAVHRERASADQLQAYAATTSDLEASLVATQAAKDDAHTQVHTRARRHIHTGTHTRAGTYTHTHTHTHTHA